jgi:hypothetical protein
MCIVEDRTFLYNEIDILKYYVSAQRGEMQTQRNSWKKLMAKQTVQ